VDFTQPPYAGPIAIFRGILIGLLTLVFFVVSVYTIKGAFAGK